MSGSDSVIEQCQSKSVVLFALEIDLLRIHGFKSKEYTILSGKHDLLEFETIFSTLPTF